MTHHHLKVGDQVPEFTLINLQDKKITPMSFGEMM